MSFSVDLKANDSASQPSAVPSAPSPMSVDLATATAPPFDEELANEPRYHTSLHVANQPQQLRQQQEERDQEPEELQVEFHVSSCDLQAGLQLVGTALCAFVIPFVVFLISQFEPSAQNLQPIVVVIVIVVFLTLIPLLILFGHGGREKCVVTATQVLASRGAVCRRIETIIPLEQVRVVSLIEDAVHSPHTCMTISTGSPAGGDEQEICLQGVMNGEEVRKFMFARQAQLRRLQAEQEQFDQVVVTIADPLVLDASSSLELVQSQNPLGQLPDRTPMQTAGRTQQHEMDQDDRNSCTPKSNYQLG